MGNKCGPITHNVEKLMQTFCCNFDRISLMTKIKIYGLNFSYTLGTAYYRLEI